jgi:hypothetical protein
MIAISLPDLAKALPILLTAALASAAQADIYKCTDEHGNVAYLQAPCPVEKAEGPSAADDEDLPAAEAELDEKIEEIMESTVEPQSSDAQAAASRRPGEQVADCKKRYRDQIDEIDAEMRRSFSPEQGDAYKERLLALTSQLRACE